MVQNTKQGEQVIYQRIKPKPNQTTSRAFNNKSSGKNSRKSFADSQSMKMSSKTRKKIKKQKTIRVLASRGKAFQNKVDEQSQLKAQDQRVCFESRSTPAADRLQSFDKQIQIETIPSQPQSETKGHILYDDEYMMRLILDSVQDQNSGELLPKFDFTKLFEEIVNADWLSFGKKIRSPKQIAKKEKWKFNRKMAVLREFFFQFKKILPKGPLADTTPNEDTYQNTNLVLNQAFTKKQKEEKQKSQSKSRIDPQRIDINGPVNHPDIKMNGLDKFDLGVCQQNESTVLNVRCKDCIEETGDSLVFANYWLKEKHQRLHHKIHSCFRCSFTCKTDHQLRNHKKSHIESPKHLYRCQECVNKYFKTKGQLHDHMQSSPNQICMLNCKFADCKAKFTDSVARDFHQLHCHQEQRPTDYELLPMGSFYKLKWLTNSEQDKIKTDKMNTICKMFPQMAQSLNPKKEDDILLILRNKEAEGYVLIFKKYENNSHFALIKDVVLPGKCDREIGYILELILTWLNAQQIGTLYAIVTRQMRKFYRKFNFFKVIDQQHIDRARSIKKEQADEIYMSVRMKDYHRNEPPKVTFPSDLPHTSLSSALIQLREQVNSTGVIELLERNAIEKYKEAPESSKNEAQASDQATTLDLIMEYVTNKARLRRNQIFDLHQFKPDWCNLFDYNNLQEEYGVTCAFSNCAFSTACANLAWGLVQWFRGVSQIHIVPSNSLTTHMSQSLIRAVSIRQPAGILKFGAWATPMPTSVDFVFMFSPEHLQYIEYRQQRSFRQRYAECEVQGPLKTLDIDERSDELDIVLRQLTTSNDKFTAKWIAKASDITMDMAKIVDQ